MLEAEICQLGARSGLTCVTYLAFVAVLAFLALGRCWEGSRSQLKVRRLKVRRSSDWEFSERHVLAAEICQLGANISCLTCVTYWALVAVLALQ